MPRRSSGRNRSAKGRLGLGRSLVAGTVLGLVVAVFGLAVVGIEGSSMQPTLQPGDAGLALRYEAWLRRLGLGHYRVGDVVFFRVPGTRGWPPRHAVKRVVAVAGETVAMRQGTLLVDGVPRAEPYLGIAPDATETVAPETVPDGHLYLLGDNRGPLQSLDSRRFGPLPDGAVGGRVVAVVWPPWRLWSARRRLLRLPRGQASVEP